MKNNLNDPRYGYDKENGCILLLSSRYATTDVYARALKKDLAQLIVDIVAGKYKRRYYYSYESREDWYLCSDREVAMINSYIIYGQMDDTYNDVYARKIYISKELADAAAKMITSTHRRKRSESVLTNS